MARAKADLNHTHVDEIAYVFIFCLHTLIVLLLVSIAPNAVSAMFI